MTARAIRRATKEMVRGRMEATRRAIKEIRAKMETTRRAIKEIGRARMETTRKATRATGRKATERKDMVNVAVYLTRGDVRGR